MGGAASKPGGHEKASAKSLHKSEAEIVRLMYPVFYTTDHITPAERQRALETWQLILDDKSPEFIEKRGTPDFPYTSCVTFFYDSFYTRLFDIHPMCRQLFKNGMRSQGKFLVKMISLALSEIDDPAKFDKNLVKLAEIHYERGVKAVEYGIVGEVLFWVLKHCLGPRVYSMAAHAIWVKVYSRMLTTIVPVAISLELKTGNSKAHEERFTSAHVQNSFNTSAHQSQSARQSESSSEMGSTKNSTSVTVAEDEVRSAENVN